MVVHSKNFRLKINKRSATELGDDGISGPRLLASNARPREDLRFIERQSQDNLRNNAKSTSSAQRHRPKLGNAKTSAGQVKIYYLPPSQDAPIGVALGSPNQRKSFEPSRDPPIPIRIRPSEEALRSFTRSESVPDLRSRPSKWKSFGSFFGKRSTSPAIRPREDEDVLVITGPIIDPVPPPRFPSGSTKPSSTSSPANQPPEVGYAVPATRKRPTLARGTSSSIAAPQQVQASDQEHVDRFLPGLPGSVQTATADLIAMSKKLERERREEEERTEEKDESGSSDRKDSLIQTPSDTDEPSPLPPPKDEGYRARKPSKPWNMPKYIHDENQDTMKEVVVQEMVDPEEVVAIVVPSNTVENHEQKETLDDAKTENGIEDSESLLEIEALADGEAYETQEDSKEAKRGPWIDVVIPRSEMERYSIMFGSVLKRDGEQDLPQGLPQSLLERRQAHLSKLYAVPESTPKAKEPDAKGDIIPQSGDDAKDPSPSLFPLPLRPTKSTTKPRPKPSPLVRSHTSPTSHFSPVTGTFLSTTPSPAPSALSPRSWSDDNILLATPASRRSSSSADSSTDSSFSPGLPFPANPKSARPAIGSTQRMGAKSGGPAEPEWEMLTTPALSKTPAALQASTSAPGEAPKPKVRIGLPASVRPVRSGVYVAKKAEVGNAREVSFSRAPVVANPRSGEVRLVDAKGRESEVGREEGLRDA